MKKIRTILGDIEREKLGFTYTHEHLVAVPPAHQKDRDLELSDYYKSYSELLKFKEAGGQTLVEASTLDYGRNVKQMRQMSLDSKINVVFTTGFNKHIYYPEWVSEKSIEEITEILVNDVTTGAEGTDSKAGFLKGGSWYNLIHPLEEKTTIAVGKAAVATGAPVWLHTEAGTMGMEMLDILEKENVDLTKVAVGHSDRNADLFYHLELLKRGAYVQFDGVGKVKYYPDSTRIELIKGIIDAGFEDKLLISGDMGRQSYLHSYGGGPGFEFIIKKFIPRMQAEGISNEIIAKIFLKNPADWLAQF